MRVFLDTNIVLDYLGRREPWYDNAATLFDWGMRGVVQLYASSMTFATISYLTRKVFSLQEYKTVVNELCYYCHITIVDEDCVSFAANSSFDDFEDAMQYRSAKKAKADIIVTRNPDDFLDSDIPVLQPGDLVRAIRDNSLD